MYPLLHPHHHVYFNFRNPSITNENPRCVGIGRGVSVLLRSKSDREIVVAGTVPARDRVIDFGKYKGKMLGTLPSSYLKWVSKNLRAGDFEEWAKLSDQVLRDPIYRDRIEWEFAFNVLNGNSSSSSSRPTGAVSELQEISERFGWDNLDKVGWSKVDFELLGTSKGSRIPRLVDNTQPKHRVKDHPLTLTPSAASLSPSLSAQPSTKRMERRERQKMRLRSQAQQQMSNIMAAADDKIDGKEDDKNNIAIANRFPGREALLRKAIDHHTSTRKRFVS